MVDTMVVLLPDTLEDMAITLASVRLKLSLKLMGAILVDSIVDIMEVLLPDTLEDMVITLASVRLKLMLVILLDTLVDILATVESIVGDIVDMRTTTDSLDEFHVRKADTEFITHDDIYTCHFELNKLDKQ